MDATVRRLLTRIDTFGFHVATMDVRQHTDVHHQVVGHGLDDPKWTDEQIIDQMLAHPILINRPIVVTEKGVKLCRPSEAVLDLLQNPAIGRFVKEDGEVVEPPTA